MYVFLLNEWYLQLSRTVSISGFQGAHLVDQRSYDQDGSETEVNLEICDRGASINNPDPWQKTRIRGSGLGDIRARGVIMANEVLLA